MPWSCLNCTYLHESPTELAYLSCSICGSNRPPKSSSSSSSSLPSPQLSPPPTSPPPPPPPPPPRQPSAFSSLIRLPTPCTTVTTTTSTTSKQQPVNKNIPDSAIRSYCPASLHRNVLPQALADELLKDLMKESESWKTCSWWVFGVERNVPREFFSYSLNSSSQSDTTGTSEAPAPESALWKDTRKPAPRLLEEASEIIIGKIAEEVRKRKSQSSSLSQSSPHYHQSKKPRFPESTDSTAPTQNMGATGKWEPTFAFANSYTNGAKNVGYHSDFLLHIGPFATIVGLNLGATRTFALKKKPSSSTNSIAATNDDNSSLTVKIPTPHNSIIVMWPGAQESWMHSLLSQSDNTIPKHSISGTQRISLTFRKERSEIMRNAESKRTLCFCGLPCALKSGVVQGTYYWFCSPISTGKSEEGNADGEEGSEGGKKEPCKFIKKAEWMEGEGRRVKAMEMKNGGI